MSVTEQIDSALNPVRGQTRVGERPLSPREYLKRAAALCAINSDGGKPKCSGQLFVGMFFDGTGNNEDVDFKKYESEPRKQKHTNVVRLYHAHPGPLKVATNGYYRYYMPGLGTAFREIGDDGPSKKLTAEEKAKAPERTALEKAGELIQDGVDIANKITLGAGSAAALNGAPRIVWGLTCVFNAVSQHAYGQDVIDKKIAKELAQSAGLLMRRDPRKVIEWGRWKDELKNDWQKNLKKKIAHETPIDALTVNVFGFSRGAAEARTFVHWLFELCEQKDGQYLFAGIPLRLQFLGLFDTVASVGMAGLYQYVEGRAGWADGTMQVHPRVEQCVHMVASTEARACFPLDSVRINGRYPVNVTEYVYPGAHSDVGGGYFPMALGRNDWKDGEDRQVARIPGYEMYCAALACGVPFQTSADTKKSREGALGWGIRSVGSGDCQGPQALTGYGGRVRCLLPAGQHSARTGRGHGASAPEPVPNLPIAQQRRLVECAGHAVGRPAPQSSTGRGLHQGADLDEADTARTVVCDCRAVPGNQALPGTGRAQGCGLETAL
ncbi:phospholipase effector Tle1 domain-containing protein [Variovorax sp. E3]|uniref:phospholipase effector Tle1 domain-containing protein n=1 Tax=Variovorax sp. E3 TaxID=1914993 RepID=UPI0018DD553F|nr:DUF2235 domain-containing protein [Variovorax sp. E3]